MFMYLYKFYISYCICIFTTAQMHSAGGASWRSIISNVLQSEQHIPFVSPGRLKFGCLPHGHLLFTTSTISSFLHLLQHIPFFSPIILNTGDSVPHLHLLFATSIISFVLHFLQRMPTDSDGKLKHAYFPHGHFRGIPLYITKVMNIKSMFC